MLIFELMTSLLLWVSIMIPVNSYLLGISERSPYKIIQDISNQTIFDGTKVGAEAVMNRSDLCEGETLPSADTTMSTTTTGAITSTTTSFNLYSISFKNIPVKSTSTEASGIISDGQNLYVSLNSASTTDYDLIAYNYKDISNPLDKLDTGPGIIGLTYIGKNIFAINSSINSAIQRFKFNSLSGSGRIEKMGDYKIPWSSSYNPIYVTKISSIYPYIFIGLKKNLDDELLSIDLNKIDLGLTSAINRKWELDSSVSAIWPMYDKYLHLLVSTAKEPEINDFCLNCDFTSNSTSSYATSPLSTFDLYGSLGNVRSLIAKNGSIFIGRTPGNNELFKINVKRDYSSTTNSSTTNSSTTTPINTYDLVNSLDVDEGIYSMLISNKNLFLVTGKTDSKIQVRPIDDISKTTQIINTTSTISDIECVGGKIFGVGSTYEMNGTTTKSITPIIFELNP